MMINVHIKIIDIVTLFHTKGWVLNLQWSSLLWSTNLLSSSLWSSRWWMNVLILTLNPSMTSIGKTQAICWIIFCTHFCLTTRSLPTVSISIYNMYNVTWLWQWKLCGVNLHKLITSVWQWHMWWWDHRLPPTLQWCQMQLQQQFQ